MPTHVRFTEEEREEDCQLVLEGLKKGQSYSTIAKDLGRSIQYIANIKKVLIERRLITQEEIDFFSNANSTINTLKKPVLQKLREGKKIEEIANELNTSSSTILKIRDLLIEERVITLDEIKELNKDVVERKDIKQKILQGFREGKYASELSVELRLSQTTISRIKRELIKEDLISEEEILKSQSEKVNARNDRILAKLKAGKKQAQIAEEEGISPALVTKLKKQFIDERKLEGQVESGGSKNNSAPKERNQKPKSTSDSTKNIDYSKLGEQEKQIIGLLLKGYPLVYIGKKLNIESFDLSTVIKDLKKKKYITSIQITEARENLKQEDEKKILAFLRRGYSQADILKELPYLTGATVSRRISALVEAGKITQEQIKKYQYEAPQGEKETMEFVLQKLKLGFIVQEIIEADENGFLTERRVRDAILKLIKSGSITRAEIEKIQGKRATQKKKDEKQHYNKTILRLLINGKDYQEIANEIGMSYDFVVARVSEMKKNGKFSDTQQKKAEKAKKRRKYSKEYEIILSMLKSGCGKKDIAQRLGRSRNFVSERIEELKEWGEISDEVINRARKDSLERKKELRNDYENAKMVLKEQRQIDERATTKYISLSMEMFKLGMLPQEDILLLRKAFEFTNITKESINFMIRVCVFFQRYDEAIIFLNTCINSLTQYPDLIDLARKSREAILQGRKKQKAIEMLQNGKNIDEVYKRVGLTESEVIELKKKYVDSDDAPPISFAGFDIDV